MKKSIIAVAFVAAVGLSAYLGFRPATESELSELQLANAEALTNDEKDESYKNGFRVFTDEKGGAYDCMKIWHDKKPDPNYPCL